MRTRWSSPRIGEVPEVEPAAAGIEERADRGHRLAFAIVEVEQHVDIAAGAVAAVVADRPALFEADVVDGELSTGQRFVHHAGGVHERLIYARIKGFGGSGPYAEYRAYDMSAQAAAGTFSVTGEPRWPAAPPGADHR